jgi:hypothetical protein
VAGREAIDVGPGSPDPLDALKPLHPGRHTNPLPSSMTVVTLTPIRFPGDATAAARL